MSGSLPGMGNVLNLNASGGSTLGAAGRGTGVDAVMGGDNKLQAFDPATMASTSVAPKPAAPVGVSAGMTAQGIPDWMSNWLASGAQGTAPTGSETFAAAPSAATSAVNLPFDPKTLGSQKTTHEGDPWMIKWRDENASPLTSATGPWPAGTPGSAPGYTGSPGMYPTSFAGAGTDGPPRITASGVTTTIPQNHPSAPDYDPRLAAAVPR